MLSMVKMLLKGEVGCGALNSHGNLIVDHGKSWKNGIVFLNLCGNPVVLRFLMYNSTLSLLVVTFVVLFTFANRSGQTKFMKQGCGNTMPDLSDLVPFHSGQVENFNLLVLGQVQNLL